MTDSKDLLLPGLSDPNKLKESNLRLDESQYEKDEFGKVRLDKNGNPVRINLAPSPSVNTPSENTGAVSGEYPPVLTHGEPRNTNMTNQDGQPLENNELVTGKVLYSNVKIVDKSKEVDINNPVNVDDGTSLGKTVVDKDHPERMEDRDQVVIDRVSGNPVLVQGRVKENKREKFQKLMDDAHKSLDGAKVGEIGLGHPFHGLMNAARKFGKDHGLI